MCVHRSADAHAVLKGSAMNMLNINGNNRFDKIAQPKLPTTDLNYETELKGAREPLFAEVLDEVESAGWERRKQPTWSWSWQTNSSRTKAATGRVNEHIHRAAIERGVLKVKQVRLGKSLKLAPQARPEGRQHQGE